MPTDSWLLIIYSLAWILNEPELSSWFVDEFNEACSFEYLETVVNAVSREISLVDETALRSDSPRFIASVPLLKYIKDGTIRPCQVIRIHFFG